MTARTVVLGAGALFLLSLLTALPALSEPAAVVGATKLAIGGYVQGRFTDTLGSGQAASTFDARRMYLGIRADVNPNVKAGVLLSGFPSMGVLEAYGEYDKGVNTARLGLYHTPFGYEAPLSSSKLITLERSKAISDLVYGPYTFDRGLYLEHMPAKGVTAALAITNGEPMVAGLPMTAQDTNDTKNITARVGKSIPNGNAGVSLMTGKHAGPAAADLQRIGADVEWAKDELTLISEYIQGEDGSVDSKGWYVTAGYQLPGSDLQPYARYDTFDPNTGTAGNTFNRITVGVNKYMNPMTRLTLEYENIDDDANPNLDGRVAFQYQVKF